MSERAQLSGVSLCGTIRPDGSICAQPAPIVGPNGMVCPAHAPKPAAVLSREQIAQWRAEHTLAAHAREIAESHDALTAELERAASINAELRAMAEASRNNASNLSIELEQSEADADAARAEVARLREALHAIAFDPIADPEDSDARCYDIIVEIAQAALADPNQRAPHSESTPTPVETLSPKGAGGNDAQ